MLPGAAAKRSARGRSEFRTNPNMKSRGEILGSRAAAQTAAFRKTVFLLGVPRCRPPRRSPGFEPLDICYFANFWDGPELTNG